jgi:hypothetical protein
VRDICSRVSSPFKLFPLSIDDRERTVLCKVLYNQILYGCYSLGLFKADEQDKFIEIGFAQRKPENDTVIDEPLAILAAFNWLNSIAQFSFLEFLRHDIGKHTP